MSDNLNIPNESETDVLKNDKNIQHEKKGSNLVDRLIEFLTGFTSDERIKLRKLKEINSRLKKARYKFYNYKTDQVLVSFAERLYEIFRSGQSIARFFDTKKHAKSLRLFLFDLFLTPEQKSLRDQLEIENIDKFVKSSTDPNAAVEKIRKILSSYIGCFNAEIEKKIDFTFDRINDISNIINFDWLRMLHKFDSEINEANFNYNPEFEPIEGKYILDELIELNDYIVTLDINKDYRTVFDYLKSISEDENYLSVLKKILQHIKVLKSEDYITSLIQLIYKDPFFKPKEFKSDAKIVQEYLLTFQLEIKKAVENSLKDLKKDKINRLLFDIFHKQVVIRLKNYAQKTNDILFKKGLSGFKMIDALNYLKAFLLDYCKGVIKPRIDNLIIKGTWTTNTYSSAYSSILEQFNSLSDKITELDNLCAEEERYGKAIRKLLYAVSHDPNAKILLKKNIFKIDSDAFQLIYEGIKLFIEGINRIKELLEDFNLKQPKIIINFHKITWDFTGTIPAELTDILKKLNNFIALLKYLVKGIKEQADSEKVPAEKTGDEENLI